MNDKTSKAQDRARERLRAATASYSRDVRACSYAQLVGRQLTPYGMTLPRFQRRGAGELVSWVATCHQLKFTGLIASRFELAELLGVSSATAQRATAELVELGWLTVRPRAAAWRSGGRWRHRERAGALEAGALLVAALAPARTPARQRSAPPLAADSSVFLSKLEQAAYIAAWRAR